MLYAAIPTIAALSLLLLSNRHIHFRPIGLQLVVLLLCLLPFYYTTAWSDWEFTCFDVKPADAHSIIDKGFCKGIRTNPVNKELIEWIQENTQKYSSDKDYIISCILTPMVYMIAKRRPAIDRSFLYPPSEKKMFYYNDMIKQMIKLHRQPAMAFFFTFDPLVLRLKVDKDSEKFSLKGDRYRFPRALIPSFYLLNDL